MITITNYLRIPKNICAIIGYLTKLFVFFPLIHAVIFSLTSDINWFRRDTILDHKVEHHYLNNCIEHRRRARTWKIWQKKKNVTGAKPEWSNMGEHKNGRWLKKSGRGAKWTLVICTPSQPSFFAYQWRKIFLWTPPAKFPDSRQVKTPFSSHFFILPFSLVPNNV